MQTKDALFSFHKKVVGNTLHIYNDHIYSLLHALSDESSEEGGGGGGRGEHCVIISKSLSVYGFK